MKSPRRLFSCDPRILLLFGWNGGGTNKHNSESSDSKNSINLSCSKKIVNIKRTIPQFFKGKTKQLFKGVLMTCFVCKIITQIYVFL